MYCSGSQIITGHHNYDTEVKVVFWFPFELTMWESGLPVDLSYVFFELVPLLGVEQFDYYVSSWPHPLIMMTNPSRVLWTKL